MSSFQRPPDSDSSPVPGVTLTADFEPRPAGAAVDRGRVVPPRRAALQGKALEILTQVLLVALLPRLLGPVEFGRLTVALAIVTLASVAISLGAPSAFARFIPAQPEERRAGLARTMTARLLPVRAIQLTVACTAGLALTIGLPGRFPLADTALILFALAVEVSAILAAQIALGIGRTWVWSFRIAAKNAMLLLAVPLLFRLFGPVGVLQSLVLSSAAGLTFAGWTVVGLLRRAAPGVPVPSGAARYGMVAGVAALLMQLMYRTPVLAAGIFARSAVETGFVALATSIALALMFAVREVFTVSLPELVEHWGRDRDHAEHVLRRLGWWAEAGLVPCAIAGTFLLARALPLIAGERFAPATPTLVPVLALMPLLPLPLLGWQAAALRLQPGLAVAINGVGAAIFVPAALFLIAAWGAPGASAALLIAVTASSVMSALKLPEAVPARLLLSALAAGASVLFLAASLGLYR
jgi:O-antigen/teichoic acid export membrane protein